MAAGNKHLGYKAALNAIEAAVPGQQARLLLRVPGRGRRALPAGRPAEATAALAACERCGAPTTERGLRLLPAGRADEPAPSRSPFDRPAPGGRRTDEPAAAARATRSCCSTPSTGATSSSSTDGGEFHSHAGVVPHDDLIGQPEGVTRPLDPRRPLHRPCGRRWRTSC